MNHPPGPFLLRRLIWREWLKALLAAVSILFLLFSVAEIISGLLRTSVTASEVFVNYLLSLPFIFSKIIPLSCMLASLFSFQRLRGCSELMAIFASGLSRKKFVLFVLQIASIITIVQFINVFYLDPFCKELHKKIIVDGGRKFKKARSKGLLTSVINSGRIWYRSDKYYISYTIYDKNQKALIQPTFFYFDENNENTKMIKAERAIGNEQGIWTLSRAQMIKNISGDSFPELQTQKELRLSLEEVPSDFDRVDNDLNTLGPTALFQFILQIRKSGISANEYEIFFLGKIVDSIICLIFALIPATIIFSLGQRNSSFGRNVLFILLFTLSYWTLYSTTLALGNSTKIPSLAAAFAAPLLCILYLFYTFAANRNL